VAELAHVWPDSVGLKINYHLLARTNFPVSWLWLANGMSCPLSPAAFALEKLPPRRVGHQIKPPNIDMPARRPKKMPSQPRSVTSQDQRVAQVKCQRSYGW
jgi:hypothetical protein